MTPKTPKEWDEWNLRVNKPLIAWSVEKPGVMLVSSHALWIIAACAAASVVAASVLLAAVVLR